MRIDVEKRIEAEDLDAAWTLYTRAFEELRRTAVQRHMMHRDEFDAVMADERVWKYRAIDEEDHGRLAGLASFSNELDAMPLISPDYFAYHWPEHYAEKRVFYIGFFAIDPTFRGGGAFREIIAHMWDQVLACDGIAMLDICRRNDELGLPRAIHHTLIDLTEGARATPADEQTFWLYEPPARS